MKNYWKPKNQYWNFHQDLDNDGVEDRKDCNPFNPLFQDNKMNKNRVKYLKEYHQQQRGKRIQRLEEEVSRWEEKQRIRKILQESID
jgi:hypothetical protein